MNASLGTKQHCPECSAKFYDMCRMPVTCPKCDFLFPEKKKVEAAAVVMPKVKSKPKVEEFDDEDEVELEGMEGVAELEELDEFEDEDVDHLREVEDHHEDPEVDPNSDDAEDEMFLDDLADSDPHLVDEPDDYYDDDDREAM